MAVLLQIRNAHKSYGGQVLLDGAEAIAESAARINAIARQPDEDYPLPSGNHLPIGGRA